MGPGVLVSAVVLFSVAFLAHWAAWRLLGPPRAPALTLSCHFLAAGALYWALLGERQGRFELSASLLFYVALSCAYIQTMPTALVRSPSLQMLLLLEQAGSAGLSRQQLHAAFGADEIGRRIDELLKAGLVRPSSPGRLRNTWRGDLSVKPLVALRCVLGLPTGRG